MGRSITVQEHLEQWEKLFKESLDALEAKNYQEALRLARLAKKHAAKGQITENQLKESSHD